MKEENFSDADDANIPVGIFIYPPDEENALWRMTADNYMPRKSMIGTEQYNASADSRDELVRLIKTHVVPLYQSASNHLNAMVHGEHNSLYYWNEISEEKV